MTENIFLTNYHEFYKRPVSPLDCNIIFDLKFITYKIVQMDVFDDFQIFHKTKTFFIRVHLHCPYLSINAVTSSLITTYCANQALNQLIATAVVDIRSYFKVI